MYIDSKLIADTLQLIDQERKKLTGKAKTVIKAIKPEDKVPLAEGFIFDHMVCRRIGYFNLHDFKCAAVTHPSAKFVTDQLAYFYNMIAARSVMQWKRKLMYYTPIIQGRKAGFMIDLDYFSEGVGIRYGKAVLALEISQKYSKFDEVIITFVKNYKKHKSLRIESSMLKGLTADNIVSTCSQKVIDKVPPKCKECLTERCPYFERCKASETEPIIYGREKDEVIIDL